MNCARCKTGKVFLDRVFTDNVSFETSCLHCGRREFVNKSTELGKWLSKLEEQILRRTNGLGFQSIST